MTDDTTRLNKHIAETGFCSRREADRLIAEKRVTLNGKPGGIGSQVEPAACDGSVLCFVAPFACMGPPLTESPGWCQVIERNGTRWSPSGASTTAGVAIHEGMAGAQRNGGNRCRGIRYRARHQLWLRRASGAPGDDRRQVADIGSTNDFYRAATSGVAASPIQDRDFGGR